MSQRDVLAEIRAASTPPPESLRDRVRLLEPPQTRRRLLAGRPAWRRVAIVGAPALAVAAAAATAVVLTRPASHPVVHGEAIQPFSAKASGGAGTGGSVRSAPSVAGANPAQKAFAVPVSPGRLQQVTATLSLTVPTQSALSHAADRAVAAATSLGGHVESVTVAEGRGRLVLAIPRSHVQAAVTRLARLGTVAGEQFDVRDLSAGVAASDRTIARLQRQLKALRAEPRSPATAARIAALTARVEALQRQAAATRRASHFATVTLTLATPHPAAAAPHRHGPLHGLVVALRWTGIGLVYALTFGVPLALLWLAARWLRRRREDALLGSV